MKNEIPAKGSLKDYSLSQILTSIATKRKTGILILQNKDIMKLIYIEDGYIIFASTNEEGERLGEILLRTGKITAEQHNKSVMFLNQTDKRIGEIFLELGYLTPRDLYSGLKQQVNEIVLSVFAWENGRFILEETSPPAGVTRLKINIAHILKEGKEPGYQKNIAFIQRINEIYEKIHTMSYYEILGIDADASQAEIKKRYLEMLKDFHPDKYPHLSEASVKDKLTEITTLLNKAYKILSDETMRFKYDSSLQRWSQKKTVGIKVVNAERQFKRGLEEFKKSNFLSAVDLFHWATVLNPQKAIYWDYLSLTLSNIERYKEAEQSILKAIELAPYNADYYVHLGSLYLKAGLKKRAQQQFEIALKWDSTNIDAQTELEKLKKI